MNMIGQILSSTNWWFVVVMTVISMVLGMIWYGPLFGKLYGKYLGMTEEQMNDPKCMEDRNKTMMPLMIGELITRFVFYIGLAWLFYGSEGISEHILIGLSIFIFFILTTQLSAVLWGTANKRLVFITGGKMLLDVILAAIVYVYWLH